MDSEKEDLIQKYIKSNAFGRLVGMDFKIMSPGNIEYRLKVEKQHLATPHAAHGGMIGALVDGALGTAGLSLVYKEYKAVSTIEYKLNFLSPSYLGDELLAIGKVESQGKRILVISCDVFCINRENILIAKALGTFNAYDAVKAGL
jgi:uncharacterized protein (TIGR00369 family)